MSRLLKWLLAPYAPGGWFCMSAVGADDGGTDEQAEDEQGEPEQPDDPDPQPDDPDADVDDGSEDENDGEGDPQPGEAPKAGRRQGRIERLNARLAAETQARAAAEAEAARARAQQQPQGPTRSDAEIETEIQRQEEAAGLKYEQRLHNSAQRHLAKTQQRQQQVENVLADKLDAIEYATECQGSEIARRHKDEVERRLKTMRDGGRNAPRMGLLALIVGESVLKQSKGKKTSKTREDAETRISQRRGEPPGNRSDASNRGGRKDDAKAREKRLLGQRI